MILVYRYRVKSINGLLNKQSRAMNDVWSISNDTRKHALKWNKRWPSGFDLSVLTTGSSKELDIHSGTITATREQYAKSRSQHRRPYLRHRNRKSLGRLWPDRDGIFPGQPQADDALNAAQPRLFGSRNDCH